MVKTTALTIFVCSKKRAAIIKKTGKETEMIYILVSHKIADFEKWKPVFDSDEKDRKAYGVNVKKLFRAVDDPNDIHILFEAPDAASAKACIERPLLKDLMLSAGVISEPVFKILSLS